MRKTEILPWTEDWMEAYCKEERVLKDLFKDEWLEFYHIGSTSIPTIGFAKPIIDILMVVKDIERVDRFNEKMSQIGYSPRGENGISGRRYFSKGKEKRTHHVHIYQQGNENIRIHLDFKEYLMNNPEEARRYGDLKIELAKQFPHDTTLYQDGKEQFVNELVERARKWSLGRGSS